jgi:hypothetical protein
MAQRTSVTNVDGDRPGWSDWPGLVANVLLLASVRRPDLRSRGSLFFVALVVRLAGVALLGWIGWVHWVLWQQEGYKHIPTSGPFFLVDAIAVVLLALVLLAWPRPLVGLVSAGFTASTILALVISLTVGLFGFNESISANYVVEALVLECAAVVILLAWTVIAASALPRRN